MKYRAIKEGNQSGIYTLEAELEERRKGLLSKDAEILWEIDVATLEEARAIFHLRMGLVPFEPIGEWSECPNCGAIYYPEASGQCWQCGKTW